METPGKQARRVNREAERLGAKLINRQTGRQAKEIREPHGQDQKMAFSWQKVKH